MLKNAKKWSLTVVSVTLIIIILFGISTYCIDPLVQYGKGGDRFTYWMSSEMYTNPGIAKNYEYDAVIVGSWLRIMMLPNGTRNSGITRLK